MNDAGFKRYFRLECCGWRNHTAFADPLLFDESKRRVCSSYPAATKLGRRQRMIAVT